MSGQDSDKDIGVTLNGDVIQFLLECERKKDSNVGDTFNNYRVPVAVKARNTDSTVSSGHYPKEMNFCFDGRLEVTVQDTKGQQSTASYMLNIAQFPTSDYNLWLVGSQKARVGPLKGTLIVIPPEAQSTSRERQFFN